MSAEFKQFLNDMRPNNPAMLEAVIQAYDILDEGFMDGLKGTAKALKNFAYDYVGAKRNNSSTPSFGVSNSSIENLKEKGASVIKHAGKAIGTTAAALSLAACAGNGHLNTDPNEYVNNLKNEYCTQINVNNTMTPGEMSQLASSLVEKMREQIPETEDYNVQSTKAWKDAVAITTAVYALDSAQGDKLSLTINDKIAHNLKVNAPDIRTKDSREEQARKNRGTDTVKEQKKVQQDENGNYIYGADASKAKNYTVEQPKKAKPAQQVATAKPEISNFNTRTQSFEV